jgi:2-phosphosulfolactate phosphatase
MAKLEVCPSPEMIGLYGDLSEKNIVVTDIFRATSCIVSGLAMGVNHIIPVDSVEACRELGKEGYFTAGERKGIKIEDFDFGNSPFQYMSEKANGNKIAMTTTNGTRAIEASRNAKRVLIGAFLNLEAVVKELTNDSSDLIIFCAGWRGRLSMEDTLFAGALASELSKKGYENFGDGAFSALKLWEMAKADLFGFLSGASHAERLRGLGAAKDIEFCITLNKFNVVPYLDGRRLKV